MSDLLAADGDRTKLYKNVAKSDVNDSRRRRNENSIELRRQRRNDELMKRRNLNVDFDDAPDDPKTAGDENSAIESDGQPKPPALTIEQAIQILTQNPTVEDLRVAFGAIRRLLSSARDPPIDAVIAAGLLDALAKALDVDDERVQFEAAWALTNVVSGTAAQTAAAVRAGVAPALVRLCLSPSAKVAEQVIWAVANIVGDSAELRDLMLAEGLLAALGQLALRVDRLGAGFVQIIAWTMSNLVRHKRPQVPASVLTELAPIIAVLLKYPDANTQQDTCWALSFMTDGTDENMELALKCGVLPTVVEFLHSNQPELVPPSLRVLGNFATGADHLTQVVIETRILESTIPNLLISGSSSIVKECCWLISNVVAGTQPQIQSVIDSGVMPLVVGVLRDGEHRSQVEAGWVLANLVHGGTAQQILQLARIPQTLSTICKALAIKNNDLVVNMLEALNGILTVISTHDYDNMHAAEITVEEANGLDHLESLQHSESKQIYELAYKIIDDFFNDDGDGGEGAGADENLAQIGDENKNANFANANSANSDNAQMDVKFQF